MKRKLRWLGILIAGVAYVALTVRMNSGGVDRLIAAGEAQVKSEMRPYWWVFYFGVALVIISWFLPKRDSVPRDLA